jgi:D-alanine-D-alanine ligase
MKKLRLALISGGISSERNVSLRSGDEVFKALDKEKYRVRRYDPKTDIPRLVADASQTDFALIILHGPYGEDGTIQGLLDLLGIPYQGAGVLGSAVAMNKAVSKKLYEYAGLSVPAYRLIRQDEGVNTAECIQELGLPLMVKPVTGGSSIGSARVSSAEELPGAMKNAFQFDHQILLESYIQGIEITAGVIGNASPEVFPLLEVIPDKNRPFLDYEAKYTASGTQVICPARISDALTRHVQDCARRAHQTVCCRGYSRTDMILRDDEVFILETNTIPGMTPASDFPRVAQAAGIDFKSLLDRLIELGGVMRDA